MFHLIYTAEYINSTNTDYPTSRITEYNINNVYPALRKTLSRGGTLLILFLNNLGENSAGTVILVSNIAAATIRQQFRTTNPDSSQ